MSTLKADAVTAQTTNGNIDITGNGTGKVRLGDGNLIVPDADAAAGQVLTTDGSANLTFAATPGTSGNVLTSNGSAWTSAAAAGGGAWTYISTVTASDSATVDFTSGIDSTYDMYVITYVGVVPQTNDQILNIRVSVSSSFQSGGTDYSYWTGKPIASSGSTDTDDSVGNDRLYITGQQSNSAGASVSGVLEMWGTQSTSLQQVFYYRNAGTAASQTYARVGWGSGNYLANSAIDGVQFLFASGNVASGVFRLYGVANS